jgi:hypothetical protein
MLTNHICAQYQKEGYESKNENKMEKKRRKTAKRKNRWKKEKRRGEKERASLIFFSFAILHPLMVYL